MSARTASSTALPGEDPAVAVDESPTRLQLSSPTIPLATAPLNTSVLNATTADGTHSDMNDIDLESQAASTLAALSPNGSSAVAHARRPFGATPFSGRGTPHHVRRESGPLTSSVLTQQGTPGRAANPYLRRTPPPQQGAAPSGHGHLGLSTGSMRSPPPQGAAFAGPGSFAVMSTAADVDDNGSFGGMTRATSVPGAVLRTLTRHVRNRGGGSRGTAQAEELHGILPRPDDPDDASVDFVSDAGGSMIPNHASPQQVKQASSHSDGVGPSTEAAGGCQELPRAAFALPGDGRLSRQGSLTSYQAPAADPYRGDDTRWTLVTTHMAAAWLVVLCVYVIGVLTMGASAWRVAANIPSTASGFAPDATSAATNATAIPNATASRKHAVSDGPCGSKIPQVLIAIAFFTVVFAVLMIGWLLFFGLLVLPKLRNYRPGVGQLPFKVLSVFTPFVGYTALVVVSLVVAVGVSLYGLSLTANTESYAQDVCGAPFTTLKAISISLVATTAVLLVAYAIQSVYLGRVALRLNRAAFVENLRHRRAVVAY